MPVFRLQKKPLKCDWLRPSTGGLSSRIHHYPSRGCSCRKVLAASSLSKNGLRPAISRRAPGDLSIYLNAIFRLWPLPFALAFASVAVILRAGGWRWTNSSPTRSGPEGSSRNEFRFGLMSSLPPRPGKINKTTLA